MSIGDRVKWDGRYGRETTELPPPDEFLVDHADLLGGGRALDVACGRGATSLFLADRGLAVDAVDISYVALSRLQSEARRVGARVRPFVADLDYYPLPREIYDLVTVFYFFSPRLIPSLKASLKRGGLILYATYNHRHTDVKPGFNEAYLVPRGGLPPYFPEFDIVASEEEAGTSRNICRLVAVKP
jgi:tellurite methyltransferase